jgi:putative transposase
LTATGLFDYITVMPRTARSVQAGLIYHVLNRGNGRMRLFYKDSDFAAFQRVLGEGLESYDVDLLTYCLMGNHWHLVVRPRTDDALGRFMGWVGVTHVRRHHEHYHTRGGGHLYQGRYKSFPVQEDRHFLTLCRYVEANPVRAKLVKSAADWPWSGWHERQTDRPALGLTPWPVDRPRGWLQLLDQPLPEPQVTQLRQSANRGRPLGQERWVIKTAERLSLQHTLRDPGRPRKENNQ